MASGSTDIPLIDTSSAITPGYLTVTELNSQIGKTLERAYPQVKFQGEISELKVASSGHLYFTIKDSISQVPAVMWQGTVRTLKFTPAVGMSVLCGGAPNIFGRTGRFQIVVRQMTEAGEGLLRAKFLELKKKLESEGLFDQSRKRPLPFLPRAIGIVTSRQGAAVHDIMVRLQERMPQIPSFLVDVRVQGAGAAAEIADGIRFLSESGKVDLMIVGRGGGSAEDLWSFNEEVVVRAIFASKIPVVSAVGHEVDVTLSDLAADVRAPTPTAAAEMVVPRRQDLLARIQEFENRLCDLDRWFAPLSQEVDELAERLRRGSQAMLAQAQARIETAEAHLRTLQPQQLLAILRGKIESLDKALGAACEGVLATERDRLETMVSRLERTSPLIRVTRATGALDQLHNRLQHGAASRLSRERSAVENLATRFESLNPLRVLDRGYSLVFKDGVPVRSVETLALHDDLEITFAVGKAHASVAKLEQKSGGQKIFKE